MKKTFALILCICMAFSLCACAGLDAIRNTELPPLPTPVSAPEETPAPAAEQSAAPGDPESGPAEETAPVSFEGRAELGEQIRIFLRQTKETEYAPDDEKMPLLTFSYVTPEVRMDGDPAAAEEINEQLRVLDELYYSGFGDDMGKNHLYEIALDNYAYAKSKNTHTETLYSSFRSVDCMRADSSAISFLYWTSVYTGGAQDQRGYVGRSYSSETGEKLTLDMLAPDAESFREKLAACVISAAREDQELYHRISQNDMDADAALGALVRDDNWYFSGEGIVFFSSWGEIGPEEYGILFFTVPYTAIAGVIEPKYLPALREGDGSVSVTRIEDVEEGSVSIIDRVVVSDGDELCLKVDGTVYDLMICSFYYLEQVDEDERFYESARHWYANYMTDCALQLCTLVPEGMPDLMIRYTDSSGVQHRRFISQSGADGGVMLVDDTIQAVG